MRIIARIIAGIIQSGKNTQNHERVGAAPVSLIIRRTIKVIVPSPIPPDDF